MSSFRSKHPFLPYALQEIDDEDREAVVNALKGELLTRGEHVARFEESFRQKVDAPFAVAFSSGSTALWAAALSLDLTPIDRLFSTPNTFISSVGSFTREGAALTLVDIDPQTGSLDLERLLAASREAKRTRGRALFLPVHFGGGAFDVKAFDNELTDPESLIIEDAAHALGSSYPDGTAVGSSKHSEMTIFSFHPAKTITTGEGGMVTTASYERAKLLKEIRDNGIERNSSAYPGDYLVKRCSSNLHMNEMQAALGLSQLKKLERFVQKRRALAAHYESLLQGTSHLLPLKRSPGAAPHLFVVRVAFGALNKSRREIMEALKAREIGTQVHYPPLYRHLPFEKIAPLEETERYFEEALSLPLFTQMEEEDVAYVVESLKRVLGVG